MQQHKPLSAHIHGKFGTDAMARTPAGLLVPEHITGRWTLEVFDPRGRKIDERYWENLVTTQGRNHMLSVTLDGATQDTTWFLFLISATPTVAAADTFASHSGWTEVTAYTEAARQAWTGGTAASGSIDNSAAVATFTINANGTSIGGAGLGAVDTKGSSSSGDVLFAVGAFTGGNITLNSGSTVQVTATFSLS